MNFMAFLILIFMLLYLYFSEFFRIILLSIHLSWGLHLIPPQSLYLASFGQNISRLPLTFHNIIIHNIQDACIFRRLLVVLRKVNFNFI